MLDLHAPPRHSLIPTHATWMWCARRVFPAPARHHLLAPTRLFQRFIQIESPVCTRWSFATGPVQMN